MIRINDPKIVALYLSMDSKQRQEMCKIIINYTLRTISYRIPRCEKLRYILPILERSIEIYALVENFENCEILHEVKLEIEAELQ